MSYTGSLREFLQNVMIHDLEVSFHKKIPALGTFGVTISKKAKNGKKFSISQTYPIDHIENIDGLMQFMINKLNTQIEDYEKGPVNPSEDNEDIIHG